MNPSGGARRRERSKDAGSRSRRPAPGQGHAQAQRRRIFVWSARLAVALGLSVGVGYLPYHLYLRSGLSQFVGLRAELAQLQARNEKLRAGIVELRLQLKRFQEDSEAIERVARDELGMVRSGEVIFKVE
jgi:cell division protein FtsB